MKIGIIGFGKMGKTIAQKAVNKNFEILCVFDIANIGENIGKYIGKETSVVISNANKIGEILKELKEKPDVIIDFSHAKEIEERVKIIAKEKINIVIGTTGISDEQKKEIFEAVKKEDIGLVMSPNMSVGVNVYWKIIEYAGKILKSYGFEAEIIEEHHKEKKDAPSGTAKKIQEILNKIYNKEIPAHSI
ncbi:MAG: 4-hydroxy-tetrahydrodipicolinate reductase, partial [Candidatus Altarchaeaceae archaeon]